MSTGARHRVDALAPPQPPAASPTRLTRTAQLQLVAVAGFALVLRLLVVLGTPHFAPETDASDFDRIAVSLARSGHFPASVLTLHGGPTAFRPPAFPLLLSLVYRLTGTADAHLRWEGGRILEAVLGAITVGLIWALARRLFGARVGLVAGLLACVYPPLILVGTSLLSESLFIPVVLAAVLSALGSRRCLDGARRRSALLWAGASGLLITVAALSRSNGIVIAIPLACIVWAAPRPFWRRARFSGRALAAPALLVATMLLTLVPWTVRNADKFNQLIPITTQGGYSLEGIYNPTVQSGAGPRPGFWAPPLAAMARIYRVDHEVNEAQMASRLASEADHYIEQHPLSVVRESAWSLPRLLSLSGNGFTRWIAHLDAYPLGLAIAGTYGFWLCALLSLGGVGVLLARRRGEKRQGRRQPRRSPGGSTAVWWCPALLFLSALPIIGDARYRAPADPFLLILAGVLLVAVWDRFGPIRRRATAPAASQAQTPR